MRPSPPRSSTACSTTATSSAFGASRFACARRASWSHPPDRADPGRPIGRGTRFEGLRSPPSGSHLPPNPEIDPVRPKAAPTSPRSGRTPRPYGPLRPAAPPTQSPDQPVGNYLATSGDSCWPLTPRHSSVLPANRGLLWLRCGRFPLALGAVFDVWSSIQCPKPSPFVGNRLPASGQHGDVGSVERPSERNCESEQIRPRFRLLSRAPAAAAAWGSNKPVGGSART